MGLSEVVSKPVALVFPGQGSQSVGMGRVLSEVSEAARRVFQQADEILGFPLSSLCFEGPEEELEDTINAQPAILTASIAYLEALKERVNALDLSITPRFVAGHSLGEFTAFVAAGVMDFADALRTVRERGRLMKESGLLRPGGMAAIIGLTREALEEVCAEAGTEGVVVLANDNCPGQSVISGEVAALERAMALARARGAKRAVRLDITIASHSPLMERAAQQFAEFVERIPVRDPRVPVVANVSGQIVTTAEGVRREIAQHVVRPVQWTKSVREMVGEGVTTFLEVGSSQVLGGLIRRISADAEVVTMKDVGLAE